MRIAYNTVLRITVVVTVTRVRNVFSDFSTGSRAEGTHFNHDFFFLNLVFEKK